MCLLPHARRTKARGVVAANHTQHAPSGQGCLPRDGRGAEERKIDPARARRPCLDDVTARRLARLAEDVEALFAAPQDLEWALADGEVHLLQSRPITAPKKQAQIP